MSEFLVAAAISYSVAAALLMWTAYKFNESDNLLIQMVSQLFHGFSLLVVLGLFWVAREAFIAPAAPESLAVATGFLVVATMVIAGYSIIQIIRVLFEMVKAFYDWASGLIKGGSREGQREVDGMDEGRIRGGFR